VQRKPLTDELVERVKTEGMKNTITEVEMAEHVIIGRFTDVMLSRLNCPDLEIATSISVLVKMIFNHGITPKHIKSLSQLICNPQEIYQSVSHPNDSVVIVTIENIAGEPILIPIWLNKPGRTGKQPDHWVSSAYAKTDPNVLTRWKSTGHQIWPKKNLSARMPKL
jgi:hypothetical protein